MPNNYSSCKILINSFNIININSLGGYYVKLIEDNDLTTFAKIVDNYFIPIYHIFFTSQSYITRFISLLLQTK